MQGVTSEWRRDLAKDTAVSSAANCSISLVLCFVVCGLGPGFWDLGFGVWGVGFGVWGLGFGVWGWGLWSWGL